MGGHRADHGIGEEEAHGDEDVLVLGQADTGLLGRRRTVRVDGSEHRLDLSAVDPTVLVDLIEQGVVAALDVTEVELEADGLERLDVDIGDTDLDGVVGDPRRRARRSGCALRRRGFGPFGLLARVVARGTGGDEEYGEQHQGGVAGRTSEHGDLAQRMFLEKRISFLQDDSHNSGHGWLGRGSSASTSCQTARARA